MEEQVKPLLCKLCNIHCSGPENWLQHVKGTKHLRMFKRQEALGGELSLDELSIPDQSSSDYVCDICNVVMSGPESFLAHKGGIPHLKKLRRQIMTQDSQKQMLLAPESISCETEQDHGDVDMKMVEDCQKSRDHYYCKVCQVTLSGPESATQHYAGMRHKKMLKRIPIEKVEEGIKNLSLEEKPVSDSQKMNTDENATDTLLDNLEKSQSDLLKVAEEEGTLLDNLEESQSDLLKVAEEED